MFNHVFFTYVEILLIQTFNTKVVYDFETTLISQKVLTQKIKKHVIVKTLLFITPLKLFTKKNPHIVRQFRVFNKIDVLGMKKIIL